MENKPVIWAKSIRDDKEPISLRKHTDNVKKAFSQLEYKLNDENLKESIKIAIELHDIGKVNPYFQIRTLGNKNYKPFDVSHNIYHSLFSALWINKEELKKRIGNPDLAQYILSAVAYHHWRDSFENLLRFGGDAFEEFSEWIYDKDHMKELKQNLIKDGFDGELISFDKEMLEGLKNGVSFSEYVTPNYDLYWLPKRIKTDEENKRKWILLSGLLMRSDHFASFCETEDEEYKIEERGIPYSDIQERIIQGIKRKDPNFTVSDLWQDEVLKDNGKDNTILIAPTGSGKTEFSFLWSNGEKFFYTLPLRSAVNQIYDRARAVLGEDKTGLLHSDSDIYLLDKQASDEQVEMNNIKQYDLSRQLSFPAMISTGDQFFPYALRPPGYEKIFATFYKSRLIIDEVQAYDPKAAAIIVKFIEAVIRMEGKFLLMTATLPEYIKAAVKERIEKFGGIWKDPINLYENAPENKDKYKNLAKHKIQFISIDNSTEGKPIDYKISDNILDEIILTAQSGKRVLVILNTVKQAQSVYDSLKKRNKDNIWLLHSRFTIEDRRKLEQELCGPKENGSPGEFQNPKPKDENIHKILVSTQVVEASLDLDADVLFTEIAPLDALVQRMGRVLRRYKDNYMYNKEPNVNIIVFHNGYESGNKKVYEPELIEKTYAILHSNKEEIINANKENEIKAIIDRCYVDKKGEKNFIGFKNGENKESKSNSKKGRVKKNTNAGDSIPDVNQQNNKILLSEHDKYLLVRKLYEVLDINGKYLKRFHTTLEILDAGYVSDRKSEAQKMFREIPSISIIPEDKKNDFEWNVKKFFNENTNTKGLYTNFKKKILAKYVVSIPNRVWSDENSLKESIGTWTDKDSEFNAKQKEKLKYWCKEIYFADYIYKEDLGINTDVLSKKERDPTFNML